MKPVLNIANEFELSGVDQKKLGHLIELKGLRHLFSLIDESNTLNKHGKLLVNALVELFNLYDKRYVSTLYLESSTGIKRRYLVSGINKLASLGLLVVNTDTKIEAETSLSSAKLFKAPAESEFINLAQSVNHKNVSTSLVSGNKGNWKASFLEAHNLPKSVKNTEINKGRGLLPQGFPQLEGILPDSGYSSNAFATNLNINKRNALVKMSTSFTKLMNKEDLQTLYALMTLFINQQANSMSFYHSKGIEPINNHYVELRHVIVALGKGRADTYYTKYFNSIMRISKSVFDFHELEAFFIDHETGEKLFTSSEFRFFESCVPITKTGAELIVNDKGESDVRLGKPMGFMIRWNEDVFAKLLSDNRFFVIPQSILAAPNLIFLMYMKFRYHFAGYRQTTERMNVHEFEVFMSGNDKAPNFKRDLESSISRWVKSHPDSLLEDKAIEGAFNIKTIDIEGYQLKLYMNKHIQELQVSLDKETMFEKLNLPTVYQEGHAPTVLSPLAKYHNTLANFKHMRNDDYPSKFKVRLIKALVFKNVTIKRSGTYVLEVTFKGKRHVLTKYSTNDDFLVIAESIHPENIEYQQAAFTQLQFECESLKCLTAHGEEVSKEVLDNLCVQILTIQGLLVSVDALVDLIRRHRTLISAIVTLSKGTGDIFDENKRMMFKGLVDKITQLHYEVNPKSTIDIEPYVL